MLSQTASRSSVRASFVRKQKTRLLAPEIRMPRPKVFLIEGCDFETFPVGGQLSMARSLMKLFGNSMALVGMALGDEPVGRWRRKKIDGISYWFFPASRRETTAEKPAIPGRLSFYLGLQRYRSKILSLGCKYAFMQAPESLFAVSHWGLESLCYMFPGVQNPLKISRYPLARRLGSIFDLALYSALERVAVILACADEDSISRFVSDSRGHITRERIVQMPTCVDLSEFRPSSISATRVALGIPVDSTVFVSHGRIGRFKGWQLLLDAFVLFQQKHGRSFLVFVGDGEDRTPLETAIAARGMQSRVTVTGFRPSREVACHLNAADAVVLGSLAEGWSVATLEALACGKPIVTTPVSGTREMIIPGRNGLVVPSRDPNEYASAMEKALLLTDAGPSSAAIVDQFSLTRMGERLGQLWFPLRAAQPLLNGIH
jgi:glycosyltransferase involved in cell wall biosynthesis